MRTRHGSFRFRRRRFLDKDSNPVVVFPETFSPALSDRCLNWVNRFSYAQTASLLEEFCGIPLLSEDSLWRLVQQEACNLDTKEAIFIQEIVTTSQEVLPEPQYVSPTDLYEAHVVEFICMTDAIGVSSQKPTRQRSGQEKQGKKAKRHDTDVMILPHPNGGEQFLCEGISGSWSLVDSARAFLRKHWSGKRLNVVALTDGAKTIRADLASLFGEGVCIILDWYHLAKRVYQNLSMVACSMTEREIWERVILGLLWQGKVTEAIAFLLPLQARNVRAKTDLIGYLQKHGEEIIDYGRRKSAGKVIGSGRMEKGVDQVIGIRQKNRGMSWTKAGSRALALLKVAELNARHSVTA